MYIYSSPGDENLLTKRSVRGEKVNQGHNSVSSNLQETPDTISLDPSTRQCIQVDYLNAGVATWTYLGDKFHLAS